MTKIHNPRTSNLAGRKRTGMSALRGALERGHSCPPLEPRTNAIPGGVHRRTFLTALLSCGLFPLHAQFATFLDQPFLAAPDSATARIYDSMESYSDAAAVNGLNGGTLWAGAYVDRIGLTGVQASDDMESYTNSAAVNGLNGGIGFGGAYVDR